MGEKEADESSAEASLPEELQRALKHAPNFRWVAAAIAEDGSVFALVVQFSTHVYDSDRMNTVRQFRKAVEEHYGYPPLIIQSDADENKARRMCNTVSIVQWDSDESKQEFEKWKANPAKYIADKSCENVALPEAKVYVEPIAKELEDHLLPVLQVVPSNKVLLWAKHNGYVRGHCTQKRLVNQLERTGKFMIQHDDESRLGSDVTEYEEQRDGPHVKLNEYKILKCEGRNFNMPEQDSSTYAEYAYRVFRRIVLERLWHVVLPGIQRALEGQEEPLRGYLEKNLRGSMNFLHKIECLGGSDTRLEDQLKRFFWDVIDGAQSENDEVFSVLLQEAVAAYLLTFFEPNGNYSSLNLKCIASAFGLRDEDVRAAAEAAHRENPALQVGSETLYLTHS